MSADNPNQSTAIGQPTGKFDYLKSYARRRPDEPKSHYLTRIKFIQALVKAEGHILTDERVEVLSHCFSNVKYLKNKYRGDVMVYIEKYDPSGVQQGDEQFQKGMKKEDSSEGEKEKEGAKKRKLEQTEEDKEAAEPGTKKAKTG